LEAAQKVTHIKLTRMAYKIAILWHALAKSYTSCLSQSQRQVHKLLDTPLCMLLHSRTHTCYPHKKVFPLI